MCFLCACFLKKTSLEKTSRGGRFLPQNNIEQSRREYAVAPKARTVAEGPAGSGECTCFFLLLQNRLQLVGGATRDLSDGVRIRGDINICMMGDPGVAKRRAERVSFHFFKSRPKRCTVSEALGK